MADWKAPETEPSEEELRKNIPDLSPVHYGRYLYSEGYVYHVAPNPGFEKVESSRIALFRTRCDGAEPFILYYPKPRVATGFGVTEIKDGYLYFKQYDYHTYSSSDPMYEAVERIDVYRVKVDNSRDLQLVSKQENFKCFGDDDYTAGSTDVCNPPIDMENLAKK